MDVVDFLLDGLEAALELERELGVRSVEIDRGLLGGVVGSAPAVVARPLPAVAAQTLKPSNPQTLKYSNPQTLKHSNTQTLLDLVFLHDRPLSPKGVEMMAKILTALGTPEAPIAVELPMPRAKVTVVLGGLALKKYFPGMKGEPGQWQKLPDGREVLITYSPEYILRFATVTPAVQKIKEDMWRSLKAVRQRLKVGG